MMISPSENAGAKATGRGVARRPHARLLGCGERKVSRLEFCSLEQPEIVAEVETRDAEVLLKQAMAALDERLRSQAEQMASEMDVVRNEARTEARLAWEQELKERIAEERASILRACEAFRLARTRYFAGVEAEVVKLALAIAARVLHREVNVDPLLLTGVVRVALEKVAEDSVTVLRVPTGAIEMWRKALAVKPDSSLQIVADERLGEGECVLDTNIGRVELGVSAQLEEIERGFFDLMQRRPA